MGSAGASGVSTSASEKQRSMYSISARPLTTATSAPTIRRTCCGANSRAEKLTTSQSPCAQSSQTSTGAQGWPARCSFGLRRSSWIEEPQWSSTSCRWRASAWAPRSRAFSLQKLWKERGRLLIGREALTKPSPPSPPSPLPSPPSPLPSTSERGSVRFSICAAASLTSPSVKRLRVALTR